MPTTPTATQALLDPTEFGYLLSLTGAERVFGFGSLVVTDAEAATAQQRFVDRGWLLREQDGWNLRNDLFAIGAVIANPARSIVVTSMERPASPKRAVFYSAGERVVGVFASAGRFSVEMRLDDESLMRRSHEAVVLPAAATEVEPGLRVGSARFGRAMEQTAGVARPDTLLQVFLDEGLEEQLAVRWSQALDSTATVATFEAVRFVQQRIASRVDLYVLGGTGMIVAGDSSGNSILVSDFSRHRFESMLRLAWDSVDPPKHPGDGEEDWEP